jgi:hypothetical protein
MAVTRPIVQTAQIMFGQLRKILYNGAGGHGSAGDVASATGSGCVIVTM